MKLHLIAILTALVLVPARALSAPVRTDSVAPVSAGVETHVRQYGINPYIPALVTGVGAAGLGAVAHYGYPHGFNVIPRRERGDRGTQFLQYTPLALPWVMKAAGVHTRSGWGRMAVSQGLSVAIMAGTVKGLKSGVTSVRPDGSDTHSFPSGHTAWAFMGATAASYELAGQSAWYAFGAYTMATGVAVERVLDRHHYPADVMAGAGIGILSTGLGYLIGDLIFGQRQLSISGRHLRDNNNFSFLSVSTGLNLPVGRIQAGDTRIERLPALSAGFRGGWAIDDHWGLGLELGLLSTPLIVNVHHDRTYAKSLTAVGFMVTPYYSCVLSNRVSITADVGAGYRKNFALSLDEDAVETGGGTPVGKVDVGCVVRFTHRFSAKATVGYELSRYDFTVNPSSAYGIPAHASTKGTSQSLLFSLSSRYEF